MKKLSTRVKIIFSIILFIGFLIFGYNADRREAVQETVHHILKMLQEFASKDIVGIV